MADGNGRLVMVQWIAWRCAVGWAGVEFLLLMTLEKSCKYTVARLIIWAQKFQCCVVNVKTRFRKGKCYQRSAKQRNISRQE